MRRHNLLPNTLDPLKLQQFRRTRPPPRIPIKASFQKLNSLLA